MPDLIDVLEKFWGDPSPWVVPSNRASLHLQSFSLVPARTATSQVGPLPAPNRLIGRRFP